MYRVSYKQYNYHTSGSIGVKEPLSTVLYVIPHTSSIRRCLIKVHPASAYTINIVLMVPFEGNEEQELSALVRAVAVITGSF